MSSTYFNRGTTPKEPPVVDFISRGGAERGRPDKGAIHKNASKKREKRERRGRLN